MKNRQVALEPTFFFFLCDMAYMGRDFQEMTWDGNNHLISERFTYVRDYLQSNPEWDIL